MRTLRWVLLGLVAVLVVGAVGGYWYIRPLLRTATGYAAHNACAVVHVAGRSDPATDLPPNPLVPYLRTSDDGGEVRGSVLGLLAAQKAWYTDRFGCTLAEDRPELGAPTEVAGTANPLAAAESPDQPAEVEAAIARAFGDDLPADQREALGTRAVVVVKDGELLAERYAEGFDWQTPQLGWSMTKSVANLMVGRLVQMGTVSVDDARLRPEWTDQRARITIEDLMRMSSGLEWDETYDLGTPITRMLYDEPDMAAYVAGQPAAHAPGTYQMYSSGDTNLLCAVLAERSGAGADLPRTVLFDPLGLDSAVLEPDAAGTPVCSSYMWATPRDWAAVGLFALSDGQWGGEQLLPAGWMATSTRATEGETEEDGYGAGWWVNERPDGSLVEPSLPKDAYFAEGHDGQRIIVVPSEDLVVVRLGFTPEADELGVVQMTAAIIEATG